MELKLAERRHSEAGETGPAEQLRSRYRGQGTEGLGVSDGGEHRQV